MATSPAFNDRPYQTEAVGSIWTYFKTKTGNPLVAMPTGTGKSIVIARFLQSVFWNFPTQRVMILTHVKELIKQNYEKLMRLWPFAPAGIYSAGLNQKDFSSPITFAGIASVAKKWALFGHIDLVMIDEAHLVSPTEQTQYRAFIAGLKSINPNLKIIGLTATPWRLGHGQLIDPFEDNKGNVIPPMFTDICFDITTLEAFNRLIAEGYLSPLVPRRPKTVLSTDGLHMRGGEFIEGEMQSAFDVAALTESALREAMEIGHDRKKWLIFGSGTDHCDHIGDALNALGIPTGVVHSKRPGRDQTIVDFKAGRLRAVVNNNVLTTGFDDPEIDLILVLRATASTVLWVQLLGRGTRPVYAPGYDLDTIGGRLAAIEAGGKQNCLVLDYASNTKRLGPVNDPVIPARKGQGGGTAPVKLCEHCETWNHISARYCGGAPVQTANGCGNEFSFEVKLKQESSTMDLIKGDLPIVEVYKVDHVSFSIHSKIGSPDMVKVNYYCGLSAYNEFVCPAHTNFAKIKAQQWWKLRSDMPMPETAEAMLEIVGALPAPTHLRVWVNKKYPQIMAMCFDGTAFGTKAQDFSSAPEIEVVTARRPAFNFNSGTASARDDFDDDVPF